MVEFPAKDDFFPPGAQSVGPVRSGQRAFYDAVRQLPGAQARATLALSADAVTPNRGLHAIDTEGGAATDDLRNVQQTNLPDGSVLIVGSADNARTVVVKHAAGGVGQILLADAQDLPLNHTSIRLALLRVGSAWEELFRGATQWGAKGADVASAATLTIPAVGDYFVVTGSNPITGFSAAPAGREITLRFAGAVPLTHNAATLILLGGANITTAAGDVIAWRSEGNGWRMTDYAQAATALFLAASQAEAEAGADNAKAMTPLRVKQAIAAQGSAIGSTLYLFENFR